MVIVGTAFIILGIGEIARAWAVAATLLSPGAKLPPDSPAAQSPERQSESSTTPRGPND